MPSVTAFEAKTRFGQILERVARGEEIVITRHDKPVARIVPEGGRDLSRIRSAVRELRSLRDEIASGHGSRPLTQRQIRRAVEEGRP